MTILLGIGLLLAAICGAPLFIIIGGLALLFFTAVDTNLTVIIGEMYRMTSSSTLVAIPLFTFAGYLLSESKSPERFVRLYRAYFAWMPGGLAIVSLIACAFFTAFTGASGVTIIALGGILHPLLMKDRYSEKFSLGLLTSSGSLGLLFPPSLPLILYAIVAKVNVDSLFLAGILPGSFLILLLSFYAMYTGKKSRVERAVFPWKRFFLIVKKSWWWLLPLNLFGLVQGMGKAAYFFPLHGISDSFSAFRAFFVQDLIAIIPTILTLLTATLWDEVKPALKEAFWLLPLPAIVLGGIYGGVFTPFEAASVTVVYVILVELLAYRDLSFVYDFPRIASESMVLVGGILLILGCALGLTNYLVDEQIPMKAVALMREYISSKLMFLMVLNIFLLLVGCLMDIFSAIIIVVPLILPIAVEFGVHPVHLGIIFLTNLEIGYSTPPVGLNLFISSYRFNKKIPELYRASIPFLIVLFFALLVITYVPDLSLGLVDYFGLK